MKKTISMVLALLMIVSVMFAVPFTASAAGVNAFYTFKVDTFDRLAEAVARADGGDRILLTDDIVEKIDYNNPIEFQSYASNPGGTVVLDLDGYKLDITSDKLTNLFEVTEKTQLFVINGDPVYDSYINFNSTKGYASVFKLNNVQASLIVSDVDISLSFDTNYQYTDGYQQTSVISCLDFYQFYLLDSKLTNNTCNGARIKFKSNTATSYDQSSIKILHSVIKSKIYCIDYEDNSDWASMYFMYSDLDCNEQYYKVFDLPSDCTLTFSGITGRYADAFKVLTVDGKKTYTSIDPNMKLVNFDIKCDMNFDSQLYCDHSYSTLVNTAGGHYKACTGCGISTGYEVHNGKIEAVAATCTTAGNTEGYNCTCGYTKGTTTIPATGHQNTENKAAVAATCTTKGYTAGVYCSDCKTWISGHEEIPATGKHTPKTTVTKATVTADGKTVTTCTVCEKTIKTTVIPKVGSIKLSATKYNYDGKAKTPTVTVTDSDGKTIAATNYTVAYKNNTNAGTASVTVTFKGDYYTGSKTLSFSILPGVTTKLTAAPTSTTIKLSWKAVPGATAYRVFLYNTSTKKYTTLKNTTATSYTATGLKNATSYKFAVRAYASGVWADSFKTVTATTCPGVTSKIVTASSALAIKLTWKAVPGATGYRVFLYNTSTKKYTKLKDTTATSYTASKLNSGTNYKFAVKAYQIIDGKVYWADSYKEITATTNPGTPTLKVTAGSKKATLSWNKQTGASGYVVYMATSKTGKYSRVAVVKGGSTVKYTKTGLTTGKTYYFKVAAYKTVSGKNIYGSFSTMKYAKIK